jgi:hypothetical protein
MADWIHRWPVSSITSDKTCTMAMKADGTWGCDCPVWKFHRSPLSFIPLWGMLSRRAWLWCQGLIPVRG